MESSILKRDQKRKKRVMRVRKVLKGTPERPRLSVFKSNKNLSLQLIDDTVGKTIASYSTQSKDMKPMKLIEAAKVIGQKIAMLAKQNNIECAVFDRGRHKYHGVIAQAADAAREAGLKI